MPSVPPSASRPRNRARSTGLASGRYRKSLLLFTLANGGWDLQEITKSAESDRTFASSTSLSKSTVLSWRNHHDQTGLLAVFGGCVGVGRQQQLPCGSVSTDGCEWHHL